MDLLAWRCSQQRREYRRCLQRCAVLRCAFIVVVVVKVRVKYDLYSDHRTGLEVKYVLRIVVEEKSLFLLFLLHAGPSDLDIKT